MRSEILVVLDMVLLVSALKTESPQCHVETNGCSIPKGVPRPFVETFTPACNRHDVCYRCVSVISSLFPRTLFPGCEAGKGPGIGRPIRHFDWLIDLGNSKPGERALGTRLCDMLLWYITQVIIHDIEISTGGKLHQSVSPPILWPVFKIKRSCVAKFMKFNQ